MATRGRTVERTVHCCADGIGSTGNIGSTVLLSGWAFSTASAAGQCRTHRLAHVRDRQD
ncbi:hypothetical protein HMPREF0975_01210, partial [Actinomyces sp. oral taxon 849 str. F0330]